MWLLWKFSASSVKTSQLLKKRIFGMGKTQADLELVPIANGAGRVTVHGEPAALSCAPNVWQLVFD
jgi:hypothetical protein